MMRCKSQLGGPDLGAEGEVRATERFGKGYRGGYCRCSAAASSLMLTMLAPLRLQRIGEGSLMRADEVGEILW